MQRISINGVIAQHISVMDRGLQYGDGLFETIACVNGALQFWEQHVQRMQRGAEILGIAYPDADNFFRDICRLNSEFAGRKFVIKMILTRGSGSRGYRTPENNNPSRIIICSDWPGNLHESTRAGLRLCLCKHQVSSNPALAGIKHLNRLDNVIARSEWQDEYDEGLMCDSNGHVIEGTMSNVFGMRNGTLFTPDLSYSGVDGIIRNQILAIADEENIELNTGMMSFEDFYTMDEIFISNSILGIRPVTQFNDNRYQVGETTMKLASALNLRAGKYAKALV